MKTKTLNKTAMIRNIRGLSLGDRAYCGPYGTITCTHTACDIYNPSHFYTTTNSAGNYRGMVVGYKRNARRFSVSGSSKLHNGGNWTMKSLREAIER